MSNRRLAALTSLAGLCLAPAAQAKITFDFDYSLEPVNGFFATNPAAKTALQQASLVYSDRLLDNLTAITPTGFNTWDAVFKNPATGAVTDQTVTDLSIPANTLKVYIGGSNIGSPLGLGGPGGYGVSGTQTFVDTVAQRGQSGAAATPRTDFGPWGGAIAFNSGVQWNFNLAGPQGGKNDFLTVATHELGHVLGIGTSEAWQAYATATGFTGPKAVALYGGNVPLDAGRAHFNNGVMSTVAGVAQETAMDPDITVGTRKYFTLLDFAALDDIGWDLARPGDADASGNVNFDDLLILARNYGQASQRRWSVGDFDYSGTVNFDDLLALARNYGTAGPLPGALPESASPAFAADWSAAQALAAVPEPGTTALLALGVVPALASRRRRC